MTSSCYALGLVALLLAGCETTLPQGPAMNPPNAASVFTRTPERGYRIPDAARAKLPPGIDADALEALLARVRPESRSQLMESFQQITDEAHGRPVAFGPITANTGDAEIDALVRRVRRIPPPAEREPGAKQ